MQDRVKIYVCSLEITSGCVDIDKICRYCSPTHTEEQISQQMTLSHDSGYFLSEDQIKIVEKTSEICNENSLEYEIVDIANLNLLSKMKLFFKGIRAPTIVFRGKKIEGIPTKEDLKALTD